MDRGTILSTAAEYVTKDRDAQYGSAENNFALIGRFWTEYLCARCKPNVSLIDAEDVAIMMSLLKTARIATGQPKADNYIDLCGYIACAGEIACKEEGTQKIEITEDKIGTVFKVVDRQREYDAACARARKETLK